MRGATAWERNLRILAEATALGSIIFVLLSASGIVAQAPFVNALVYIPLTVLFCVLPLALGVLGAWGSVGAIRWVARAHTIVAALFVALWGPATVATPLEGDRGPWLLGTLAIASATAVMAWRPLIVWPYVAAISLGAGVVRFVSLGGTDVVVSVQDFVSVGSFCTFIAALLMVTLAAGRAQDAALAVALADARSAAEAESRARQRARFGSFVHDDVITTLLAAAHATAAAPAIAVSALRALGRLDRFVAAGSRDGLLSGAAFEVELRSAASEIVDGVVFSGSLERFAGVIPAPVAVAMTGALGEAIRNSLRHAAVSPDSATRRVDMAATGHTVVIEASDDGRGFDPRRIAPERLGIRTSILGRMAAVPGCTAHVSSVPGAGTLVVLSWREPVTQ